MYQVDIELVGLLIENNLCHIFKNNDETPIKIGDKTFLSKELNFPLRLATVDNENILNYLEKNITKSFPDLEPFMLIKELTKNIKYNTLDVMIRNNNHKFIECLLKNYDQSYIFKELDTKNVFEIVIKNSYIFHLVSKNNELVNKFVNNYNPNFLFEPIGKSHRDLHFRLYKYIPQKKELDYILYISYIFEHDLYIRFNPDKFKINDQLQTVPIRDRLELLVQVLKEELTKEYDTFQIRVIQLFYDTSSNALLENILSDNGLPSLERYINQLDITKLVTI
jgi:hypothetical protein